MRKIVFGIRKSTLARKQLDEFITYLVKNKIIFDYSIKTIQTAGDKDQKSSVTQMGQGIFTKEIERAILNKEIDCAVHSLKDMPVKTEKGTVLTFCGSREDARDCLVAREGISANDLKGLRIGTGSPRRNAFLKELEPTVKILQIRGNVDTRLRKLYQGEYDGIVLAACGLKRLGYADRISCYFDADTFIPAAGQGVVCSQTRDNDTELNEVLKHSVSSITEQVVFAERKVLEALQVGCQTPFGVYARFEDDTFIITAKLFVESSQTFISERRTSNKSDFLKATDQLISSMKSKIHV
ncbi:MAG: hydroxymethylbilane synthase [Candidatus Omnitrophica bacterium]|nr:hydroxymethylbilane synthase [Candidatus Omnitrophota bacterium]